MKLNEPMEFTMTIEDADLEVMAKILKDIKIPECPYFDISDKYGNEARYYRENRWIPCSERLPDKPGSYICTCSDGTPYQKVTVIKFHHRTQAWNLTGTRAYWKVRAWMPLPDPWEGEKE